MENYIIIRAGVNGGKTTTCGILYEELSKKAEFSKLFDYNFNELDKLKYSEEGNLYDFIAIIILGGKVIIIISKGDIAKSLLELLELLEDKNLIKKITNNLKDKIDFYVLCARSLMRKNSTIEMLYNRISSNQRKEFWTEKSKNIEDRKNIKMDIVKDIIKHLIK